MDLDLDTLWQQLRFVVLDKVYLLVLPGATPLETAIHGLPREDSIALKRVVGIATPVALERDVTSEGGVRDN